MRHLPNTFLIDLLAMDCHGREYGCGLESRLLEMLLDRHAVRPGSVPLNRAVRQDGPTRQDHYNVPR